MPSAEPQFSLGKLVCGFGGEGCPASNTLDHLSTSINRFGTKSVEYLNTPFSEDTQSFGAFCARAMLENSCAALVGRIDPFRMLFLAELQTKEEFEYGKPTKSGFRWTGDVLTEDKPAKDLWSSDLEISKISRALFSPHFDHIYWKPAFTSAINSIESLEGLEFSELRLLDSSKFILEAKGRLARLYSTLSKGVHWDFFVSSVIMDEETLKDAIRDCLVYVGNLAFVSHFVPTAFRSLEQAEAIAAYLALRRITL